MHSPEQYRKYAEECERMARDAKPEKQAILLHIAKAWRRCADEIERGQKARERAPDDG